jgi:hypothetical protein
MGKINNFALIILLYLGHTAPSGFRASGLSIIMSNKLVGLLTL